MADSYTIPVFPLSAVVLPGEEFYLHIFEPRYKQLINDVKDGGLTFGIPYVNNGQMELFGSEVKVKTVFSVYPNGEMDISVVGVNRFQLHEIHEPDQKLYHAATVEVPDEPPADPSRMLTLRPLLLDYLQLKKGEPVKLPMGNPADSYAAALLLNLHPDKKYELIRLTSENTRLSWLIAELKILMQSRKMEIQLQKNFLMN